MLMWMIAALAAQDAPKLYFTADNRAYCTGSNSIVMADGAGGYDFTFHMDAHGNSTAAIYTADSPRLSGSDGPHVTTSYILKLDKDGKPAARPQAIGIRFSTGRFASTLPAIDRLALKFRVGTLESAAIPLQQVDYALAFGAGTIKAEGNPKNTSDRRALIVPQLQLNQLQRASDNGERTVILLQDGKELMRVTIPLVPLAAKAQEAVGWASKTAKALTARKACT